MNLRRDEPLGPHTTLRIGGPADYFVEAHDSRELLEAQAWASEHKVPLLLLGGGSNVLFDDAGFRGLVVQNRLVGIQFEVRHQVRALSGTPLDDVVRQSIQRDLEGLEFASGIPGTVGGAVCGNAGAFGKAVGDLVVEARVLSPGGRIGTVPNECFRFGYRDSRLKCQGGLVIEVRFQLGPGEPERLKRERAEALALRRERHPGPEIWSAGSFFKNVKTPEGEVLAAGHLLDQVGAKGFSVGDAAVYPKHANILINRGTASSADVLALAHLLSGQVKARFGIALEPEVRYIPPQGVTAPPAP